MAKSNTEREQVIQELLPTAADIAEIEERITILEMRKAGYLPYQISRNLNISISRVQSQLKLAIDDLNDVQNGSAAELFAITAARLESLFSTFYPQAKKGNLTAANFCRGVIADERQLHGLDRKEAIEAKQEVVVTFTNDWEEE
ncbi:MAG TPA: hypothetical protein PLB32_05265 [Acidobacteriota bacterium]|jgi:DNA-binding CsgD family transcriptional regulator|nr:hypothetical protein [Acidobacteriota bacterium]